ncbi:metal-dependent protein hydrolase [Neohortaea acidophila]|uniref:Metal-dependent protein hydrolase n=1 Tax=Neohortaea acidophila TaxID=245834 RepID=A0A6A6Q337_9PEZI|nr:metal-dependent protein hydrolase [Neohortaea acidophila]KAF2485837.1 metal-dependent protein hydrolase [Neohortaea acidophila]
MSTLTIGTHNGHFHADEALAVYLLRLLPQYAQTALIRTRDPAQLATCDVVVDVGGVHSHEQSRYDHHQREFAAVFPGSATKLSSAGLVWLHHGRGIVSSVTGLEVGSADCEMLWRKLYDDFIEAFDANDNGISAYDSKALKAAGIEKRFADKGFSIASVVNRFNHAPVVNGATENGNAAKEEDARFLRASAFVGEQFSLELNDRFTSWLPARALVKQAFTSRQKYDAKGRILVVPQTPDGGAPWADHLYTLEKENGCEGQVLYVLFAENGEPDSKWRIRAVSVGPESFENRKSLPEAWRGVRDEELAGVAGIPGCVFVHASGFIGGNVTFEGALEMAKKAVEV